MLVLPRMGWLLRYHLFRIDSYYHRVLEEKSPLKIPILLWSFRWSWLLSSYKYSDEISVGLTAHSNFLRDNNYFRRCLQNPYKPKPLFQEVADKNYWALLNIFGNEKLIKGTLKHFWRSNVKSKH